MNVLIIGSEGFIGRELKSYLYLTNNNILGYDIDNNQDILDKENLDKTIKEFKPDCIYHLAGQTDVRVGEEKPFVDMDVNIKGTYNILSSMVEHNVRTIVFSSSEAAFNPIVNYGVSKLSAEQYIKKFTRSEGLDGKIVRFSSVYGVNRRRANDWQGPINKFLAQGISKVPITVYNNGSSTRDFIHVSDLCRALTIIQQHGIAGEVYDVGSGIRHSVLNVAKLAAMLTNGEIIYTEGFTKEVIGSEKFDVLPLLKLGFNPFYDLYSGMTLTKNQMFELSKKNPEFFYFKN